MFINNGLGFNRINQYGLDKCGNKARLDKSILGHDFENFLKSPYFLDDLPIDCKPMVFYSLRKCTKYADNKCIRIRRAGDNAELDIGYVNNKVDIRAIQNFCGAYSGYVTIWYDQTNNKFNLSNGTAATQPYIKNGSLFYSIKNNHAVYFDYANKFLSTGTINELLSISKFTMLSVNKLITSGSTALIAHVGALRISPRSGPLLQCIGNKYASPVYGSAEAYEGIDTTNIHTFWCRNYNKNDYFYHFDIGLDHRTLNYRGSYLAGYRPYLPLIGLGANGSPASSKNFQFEFGVWSTTLTDKIMQKIISNQTAYYC